MRPRLVCPVLPDDFKSEREKSMKRRCFHCKRTHWLSGGGFLAGPGKAGVLRALAQRGYCAQLKFMQTGIKMKSGQDLRSCKIINIRDLRSSSLGVFALIREFCGRSLYKVKSPFPPPSSSSSSSPHRPFLSKTTPYASPVLSQVSPIAKMDTEWCLRCSKRIVSAAPHVTFTTTNTSHLKF